jgi:hypothetical protein
MAEKRKKKWIKAATDNAHDQFAAKAKAAGESTREFASKHSGDSGKLGKQSRLAETLMGMHHGGEKRKKLYTHPRSKG